MRFLYILITILLLSLFILVHELGHFMTAKWFHVKVNEFSIGMGPALFSRAGKSGTKYSIRAFPIGGYCALDGESNESDDPNNLFDQAPWKKIIIFAAGSVMNFLFAVAIILAIAFNTTYYNLPVIQDLMDGVPFESENGLLPGDEILAVNGHKIIMTADVGSLLDRFDNPCDITVRRDGHIVTNTVDISRATYIHEDKIKEDYYGFIWEQIENPTPVDHIIMAARETVDMTRIIIWSIGDLFAGNVDPTEVSGIVGIVDTVSDAGADVQTEILEESMDDPEQEYNQFTAFLSGCRTILHFMAIVGINLAVMNLLPIPALDGAHILFVLLNCVLSALHRKTITVRQEAIAHAMGMFLLCGLMAFLLVNDMLRIIMSL